MNLQLLKDRPDFIKLLEQTPKPLMLTIHFLRTQKLSSVWKVC